MKKFFGKREKDDLLGEYLKMSDVIRRQLEHGEIVDEYYLMDLARSGAAVNELASRELQTVRANQARQSEQEKGK